MEEKAMIRLIVLLCAVVTSYGASFGTYEKLFSARSLWNSMPVNPVFATWEIPLSTYYPAIASGAYSVGVFQTGASDPPVTIYGRTSSGINLVDNFQTVPNMTLPHWPASAVPATGDDGHCDVVDETTGILHSFWQLIRNSTTKQWQATQYAWTRVDGLGFGDPAHYYQGARAAGVPTSGGVIRISETVDGNTIIEHALAMSLDKTGAAKSYIYPATSCDSDASSVNTGSIPEGGLVMLPANYTPYAGASANLRKVIETLKKYGAYVVDKNTGTPFAIYVENNSSFPLSNQTGWDNNVAAELQRMRAAMRQVISADYYLDGNGVKFTSVAPTNEPMWSMRNPGGWTLQSGTGTATFDSWTQSVLLSANTQNANFANGNALGYNRVNWGSLVVNKTYTLSVLSSAPNVCLSMAGSASSGGCLHNSSVDFVWPSGGYIYFGISKPAGPAASVYASIYLKGNVPTPTVIPTINPTINPTNKPTANPTNKPTTNPTTKPTANPTIKATTN